MVRHDPVEDDLESLHGLTPAAHEAVGLFGRQELPIVSAILQTLIHLPSEHHGRASNLFRRLRGFAGRSGRSAAWETRLGAAGEAFEHQLLQSKHLHEHGRQRVVEGTSKPDDEDSKIRENEARTRTYWWSFNEEIDYMLQTEPVTDSTVQRFIRKLRREESDDSDEIFLCFLPLIEKLDGEQRADVTELFAKKWPDSSAPALFLRQDYAEISNLIERWAFRAAARPMTLNIVSRISLYTPYDTEKAVKELLRNSLRIGDTEEQAASYLGLLPFLHRGFDEGSIEDLRNPDVVGTEVACFAGMLVDLAQALSADALSDMVRAAVGLYSEWWVIETLTVICRRLTEQNEFAAVRKASLYIKNLDLRARLLGRLALRAVDVGMTSLGVQIVESIELEAARWEELRLLGLRLASAGYSETALRTVAGISFTQERDRAYAEIALEMAAQGLTDGAREVVGDRIVGSNWRGWAYHLLAAAPQQGRQFDCNRIETRRLSRALTAEENDRFLVVTSALDDLQQAGVTSELLANLRAALGRQSETELTAAIHALWDPGPSGEPDFLEAILATERPKALARIAHLGPLLPLADRELFASEMFVAVRRVIGWWP